VPGTDQPRSGCAAAVGSKQKAETKTLAKHETSFMVNWKDTYVFCSL